jgi:hypothetical protein
MLRARVPLVLSADLILQLETTWLHEVKEEDYEKAHQNSWQAFF